MRTWTAIAALAVGAACASSRADPPNRSAPEPPPPDRATTYGEILSTCAGCHALAPPTPR